MYVVMDKANNYKVYGPFETANDAGDFGDTHFFNYVIYSLVSPDA